MNFSEIPERYFDTKIKNRRAIRNLLLNSVNDIAVAEIVVKKNSFDAWVISLDKNGVIIRCNNELEEGQKIECRMASDRGIVLFRSVVTDRIKDTTPPLWVVSIPDELRICDRRKYTRVKIKEKTEVVIKRANGYAFFGKLLDLSVGGFAVQVKLKDRLMEYLLPLIGEQVSFSITVWKNSREIKFGGKASVKHYSLGADGIYKAGFKFEEISREDLRKVAKIVGVKTQKKAGARKSGN